MPLTKRMMKIATPAKRPKHTGDSQKKRKKSAAEQERPAKRKKPDTRSKDEGKDVKWSTLSHSGVLFPPEYAAHNVKMTYDGVAVDLTPEQEEVPFSSSKKQDNCHFVFWHSMAEFLSIDACFRQAVWLLLTWRKLHKHL